MRRRSTPQQSKTHSCRACSTIGNHVAISLALGVQFPGCHSLDATQLLQEKLDELAARLAMLSIALCN